MAHEYLKGEAGHSWPRSGQFPQGDSNTCDRVILPFDCGTPFRTYLYAAFPAGILCAHGRLDDALCSYYLQPFFPEIKLQASATSTDHFRLFPGLGFEQFEALGHFRIQEVLKTGSSCSDSNALIETITAMVSRGGYVCIFVNQRFIPGTWAYNRKDKRHEFLIIGVDVGKRCVFGVEYLRTGSLGVTELSFDSLAQAYFSPYGRVPGKYSAVDSLREIRLMPRTAVAAGRIRVRDAIGDYLEGRDNSEKYLGGEYAVPMYEHAARGYRLNGYDYSSDRHRRGVYGNAVYESIIRHIEQQSANCSIDLRVTSVLMEHKWALRKAIAVEDGAHHLNGTAIMREFDTVQRLAGAAHFAALDVNMRKARATAVIDRIQMLAGAETAVLRSWLKQTSKAQLRVKDTGE